MQYNEDGDPILTTAPPSAQPPLLMASVVLSCAYCARPITPTGMGGFNHLAPDPQAAFVMPTQDGRGLPTVWTHKIVPTQITLGVHPW